MFGMPAEQFRAFIAGELLELPRHFKMTGPDCVEFGSHYEDIGNAAMLMSHSLWFPADYAVHNVSAKAEEVEPCQLRRVIPGTVGYETEIKKIQADLALTESASVQAKLSETFLEEIRKEAKARIAELKRQDRRVFVKFELALTGRTARDMREMFILGKTRHMIVDPRYQVEYDRNVWNLVSHYLEAKEQKRRKDMMTNAAGQETIVVKAGG